MEGANEYCKLFKKAEQIGRLYLLPSSHARGPTFRLYVLPAGEKVIENGGFNPPLNKNSVEVYGAISGQLGWTEVYDWIHSGNWQDDFDKIVEQRRIDNEKDIKSYQDACEERKNEEANDINTLLDSYA